MCVLPSLSPHFYLFIFDFGPIFMLWTRLPFLWHSVESCTHGASTPNAGCLLALLCIWRRNAVAATGTFLYPAPDFAPRLCGCPRVPTGCRLAPSLGRCVWPIIPRPSFPSRTVHRHQTVSIFHPQSIHFTPGTPIRPGYISCFPAIWRTIQMSMLAYHLVSLVDGWEYPSQ